MDLTAETGLERALRSFLPFELTPRALTTLSVIAATAIAASSPGWMSLDDARLFNYTNNTSDAHPVFYFNAWVLLFVELIAYSIRDLPFLTQSAIYFAIPTVIIIILQREMQEILKLSYRPFEATILSLVVLVSLRFFMQVNFTWSVWLAYMAAGFYIIRKNATRQPYSLPGSIAITIACTSHPFATTLVPPLIFYSLQRPRPPTAAMNALLATAILVFYAWIYLDRSDGFDYFNGQPLEIPRNLINIVTGKYWKPHTVPIAASLVLMALAAWQYFHRQPGERQRINRELTICLAFFGLSSLAVYFFSLRFSWYRSIPWRYVIIVAAAAEIALLLHLATLPGRTLRNYVVAVAVLIGAVFAAYLLRYQGPGAYRADVEKYRYLAAADSFRRSCRPGEAMGSAPGYRISMLVVLCQRRKLDPAAAVERGMPGRHGFDQTVVMVPEARRQNGDEYNKHKVPMIFLVTPVL